MSKNYQAQGDHNKSIPNYDDDEMQQSFGNNIKQLQKVYAMQQQDQQLDDAAQQLDEKQKKEKIKRQKERLERERLEERKKYQEEQTLGRRICRCISYIKNTIIQLIPKVIQLIFFYGDLATDIYTIYYFASIQQNVYLGFISFFVGIEVLFRIIKTAVDEEEYSYFKAFIELIQLGYFTRMFVSEDDYKVRLNTYKTIQGWRQSTPCMFIVTFAIFYSDLQEFPLFLSLIFSFIGNIHSNICYFESKFPEYKEMQFKRKILFNIILITETFSRLMLWGLLCFTTKPIGIWILIGFNFLIGVGLAFSKLCNAFAAFYDQFFCFKFFEDLILVLESNQYSTYIQIRDVIIQLQNFVLITVISLNFSIIEKSSKLNYTIFLVSIVSTSIVLTYMLFRWLFSEDKGSKLLQQIKELRKEVNYLKSKIPKQIQNADMNENEDDEQYAQEMRNKKLIDGLNKDIQMRDDIIKGMQGQMKDMEKLKVDICNDMDTLKDKYNKTEAKLKEYTSRANILQVDLNLANQNIKKLQLDVDVQVQKNTEIQKKLDEEISKQLFIQNQNENIWKQELNDLSIKQEQSVRRFRQLENICKDKQNEIKKLSKKCLEEKVGQIEYSSQLQTEQREKQEYIINCQQLEEELDVSRKKEHILLDQVRDNENKIEFLSQEVKRLKAMLQEQQDQLAKELEETKASEEYDKVSSQLQPIYNIKALTSKSTTIDSVFQLKTMERTIQNLIIQTQINEELIDTLKEKQKQITFIKFDVQNVSEHQLEILKQLSIYTQNKSVYLKAFSLNLSLQQQQEQIYSQLIITQQINKKMVKFRELALQ